MKRRLMGLHEWRSPPTFLIFGAIVGSLLWSLAIPVKPSAFIPRHALSQGRWTELARDLNAMVTRFNETTYPAGAIVPYLQEHGHVPVGWEVCDGYGSRNTLDDGQRGLEALSRLDLSSKFRQIDRWRLVWIQKLREVDR